MPRSLLIVHVHIHVKAECVNAFLDATRANAENSRREPGVLRFDVIAQRDDSTRYVLVEIYRDEAAAAAHKQTAHYAAWRDVATDMMAEPRTSARYVNVSPDDGDW